ncbi:MAG TPA: hypothetical protein VJK02_09025 [Anaerolineales bacterium]|nr:hypothetical protein [Anaerolineales bacterium]
MNELAASAMKAQVLHALSILDRVEVKLLRLGRFDAESLKRTQALERATMTCPSCGSILRCGLCGHSSKVKT